MINFISAMIIFMCDAVLSMCLADYMQEMAAIENTYGREMARLVHDGVAVEKFKRNRSF